METPNRQEPPVGSSFTPEGLANLRRELAHDLSNALEIIIQTSFLLGTLDLGENGKSWHGMLDEGVQRAVMLNQKLREALRAEPSAKALI